LKLNIHNLPELPPDDHPYYLLPEHRLELDGGTGLFYREAGRGTPVLLLHGLWTGAYTFRSLIEPLAARHRVVIPQLVDPAGANPLADDDYRPERLAGLVQAICRKLDLLGPVVVGHAESGLAAMHLALDRPGAMRSLVTVGMATELPRLSLRLKGWLLGNQRISEIWAQKGFSRPQLTALGLLDYADPAVVSRQEVRELARRWTTLPGARATSRILIQTLSKTYRTATIDRLASLAAGAGSFPVPLRLVHGSADTQAPPRQGEAIARSLPGAEWLVAEGSGGAVQVEQPAWLARIILAVAEGQA